MKSGLILTIVLVLLVIIVGWFLYYRSPISQSNLSSTPTVTMLPSNPVTPTLSPNSHLLTKYITTVDWPPKINTENTPFTCTEAGSETDRAGQTKQLVINNHTYCVTKITEGAAGSIYTQYAYARAKNNQTEIFTFSLQFVQCGNYSEPEKTSCEQERQMFDINTFIDQYIQGNF
jgi:hypothetical protein